MKRILILVIVLGALGGGGYAIWWYFDTHRSPEFRFETTKVDRGKITARVTASGTLSALVTVQVGSQVSGRIQKLYVDFNSTVKRGQLIAEIDPALFKAAVQQARANVAAAKGSLAMAVAKEFDARMQFDRAKALAARDLIARADRDTAEANHKAALASIDAAKGNVAQNVANLRQVQINLDYTRIHSPTNGTVISRSVDVGQTVAASFQSPVLFLIAEDLQKMQVDTNVAEADVGKLRAGMIATFTVDAYGTERFTGTVRQIRNSPQTLQNVVTYDAVIDVPNPELKLRPGMTANVAFVYAERDRTLRVANGALRFRPPPKIAAKFGLSTKKKGRDGPPLVSSGGAAADGGAPRARRPRPDGGAPRATARTVALAGDGSKPAGAAAKPGRQEADSRTVWLLGPMNELRPIPIHVGITDGTTTEIRDGNVQEGDVLVIDMIRAKGSSPKGPGRLF